MLESSLKCVAAQRTGEPRAPAVRSHGAPFSTVQAPVLWGEGQSQKVGVGFNSPLPAPGGGLDPSTTISPRATTIKEPRHSWISSIDGTIIGDKEIKTKTPHSESS